MLKNSQKQQSGDIGVFILWREEQSSGNCMTHDGRWGESPCPARKALVITPERPWRFTVLDTPSTTENWVFVLFTLFGWGVLNQGPCM